MNGVEIIIRLVDGFEWRLSEIDETKYQNAIRKADTKGTSQRGSGTFVAFHYTSHRFDMRYPLSTSNIEYLIDDNNILEYAQFIVNKAIGLYNAYIDELPTEVHQ